MTAKNLSPEELVKAFEKIKPKRPTYPPLVADEEVMINSDTDSDESDDEHEEMDKRMIVNVTFTTNLSTECYTAWAKSGFKPPAEYLHDNVSRDLGVALQKLVNLRVKPDNPIEWLGYYLLNMSIRNSRPPSKDLGPAPTGPEFRCYVQAHINPLPAANLYIQRPFAFNESYQAVRERFASGKRKMTNE